jgi:hypothetical protein
VLYAVVRDHLDGFLRETSARSEGEGLPEFVEREFREFLTCGILAHGFARFRCEGCALECVVPFSCKGRGFCPSCGGRRMTERAARLVDEVLPWVPVRQWVLTMPYRLRYLLAWNHRLCRGVLGVYARALLEFYRCRADDRGVSDGRTGTLTVIQRFGSGLNLNVHFHTLALDGVFHPAGPGEVEFDPAPPPSDEEVARVLATIRRRVGRLLARRGLDPGVEGAGPTDGFAEESPVLAGLATASVLGRSALGSRAGAALRRLGDVTGATARAPRGPRQAQLEGFDLHANVWMPTRNRAGLERLCRYLLRPPLAQERLRLRADGRILVELRKAWRDGTTHLLFEPIELLEKLAALTPRPEAHLLLYHGVLAPHAAWRRQVARFGEAGREDPAAHTARDKCGNQLRDRTWATLMGRAFGIDVLACPRCGGRLQLIATIEDPTVVRKILTHLGLAPPERNPGPGPPLDGAGTAALPLR